MSADDLLRGCLHAVSRFGLVQIGTVRIDLEAIGVLWMQRPERAKGVKVAYSVAVVALMDRAALIAKADGADGVDVEHLLVAFASEENGLMGELKRRYGLDSLSWRSAVAERCEARLVRLPAPPNESAQVTVTRDYLTPEQAAEALGLHVQTLRGYVRSGKLPASRLAGERAIRIRRSDLEAVLEPLVP